MIVFENKGLIDIRAFGMFGVSVKESDNPIGFFGTGLKYALAVLLRNKQTVVIWRGKDKYEFTTNETTFRNEDISIVCMNGQELGFTLDLGKTWEVWMAFRELYCNAMDEPGGSVYDKGDEELVGNDGYTIIGVEGVEAHSAYDRRSDFILQTRPVATSKMAEAHVGPGNKMFYKGIAVHEMFYPAAYNYNLREQVELTEDRTLKYNFRGNMAVGSLIMSTDDAEFVEEVLTRGNGTYEHTLNFHEMGFDPSKVFLDVVGKIREESTDTNRNLNVSAGLLHRLHVTANILPNEDTELNDVQTEQLKKAKLFVSDVLGCDLNAYPIVILDTLGPGHLGRAANGKIYVAKKAFDSGTKWVAAALYEEYIHLKEKVEDESHGQKMIYLEKILSMGEQLQGKPL